MPEALDVSDALKGLRLHHMCAAWADLDPQGGPGAVNSGRWLIEFDASKVHRALVEQLADMAFTELAHSAVFIGGPGTGKTYLSTPIGVAGITRHGKQVRFYSTVDLVNALEREKAQGHCCSTC